MFAVQLHPSAANFAHKNMIQLDTWDYIIAIFRSGRERCIPYLELEWVAAIGCAIAHSDVARVSIQVEVAVFLPRKPRERLVGQIPVIGVIHVHTTNHRVWHLTLPGERGEGERGLSGDRRATGPGDIL